MKKYIILIIIAVASFSCDEDILQEKPLDFLSPENSYTSEEGIEAAVTRVYGYFTSLYEGNQNTAYRYLHAGTDLATGCRSASTSYWGAYTGLTENSGVVNSIWSHFYKIIFDCNVVLDRIGDVTYIDESRRAKHIAEARFFRGYAYKVLGNLYGGVPLVLNEITGAKRDFVRSTLSETYAQAIEDFEFAATNLPSVTEVDKQGHASNAAANHFLSELYITVQDWDKAITKADLVINDPSIELMKTRFGNRATDDGDPYWDLFQRNNQNRGNGNLEGIMVLQEEIGITGGSGPGIYNAGGWIFERVYGPLFWQLKDENKVAIFNNRPTTHEGGRGVGFIRPSSYYSSKIWSSENWNVDNRNNNLNLIRDWVVSNPKSAHFGEWASTIKDEFISQDTLIRWYPMVGKLTILNDHPSEIMKNYETGELTNLAGKTFTDWYFIRVAETYLLRAEAKLGKGNPSGAADDINEVRGRVNAIPVLASEVNIDYILDERMRELNFEENRRATLARLGKVVERTRLGNEFAGLTISDHQNLFPIPASEIERNTEAVLEQNDGY